MIAIENLRVERHGKAICRVDRLVVAPGRRLVVAGRNGSGKTTLLRVIAGLQREFLGDCRVAASLAERTYVHQRPYLFRGTVLSNVCYGPRAQRREAGKWLERLGVAELAERDAQTLSGGERRRVALARALAIRPKLLLVDEPLAELDPAAGELAAAALMRVDATLVIASPTDLPQELAKDVDRITMDS